MLDAIALEAIKAGAAASFKKLFGIIFKIRKEMVINLNLTQTISIPSPSVPALPAGSSPTQTYEEIERIELLKQEIAWTRYQASQIIEYLEQGAETASHPEAGSGMLVLQAQSVIRIDIDALNELGRKYKGIELIQQTTKYFDDRSMAFKRNVGFNEWDDEEPM